MTESWKPDSDTFGTADAASALWKAWTNYELDISAMVSGKEAW